MLRILLLLISLTQVLQSGGQQWMLPRVDESVSLRIPVNISPIAVAPFLAIESQFTGDLPSAVPEDRPGTSPEIDPVGVALGGYIRIMAIAMAVLGVVIYVILLRIKRRGGSEALARRLAAIFTVMARVIVFIFYGLGGLNIFIYLVTLIFDYGVGTIDNLIGGALLSGIAFAVTRIKLPLAEQQGGE